MLLRMDDITKHDRVGCVVCLFPCPTAFESLVNEYRCRFVGFHQDAARSTNPGLRPGDMRQVRLIMKLGLA